MWEDCGGYVLEFEPFVCGVFEVGSSSMLSSLALRFSVGSSGPGPSEGPLNTPDAGREMGVSFMLGGEGLESEEGGDGFGRGKVLML